MLRSTVLAFRPDVLLVDHMPHGAMGELVPTLEALRDESTVVLLGLREGTVKTRARRARLAMREALS